MSVKSFCFRRVLPSFFHATALMAILMATIGTVCDLGASLSYGILFAPFVYGLYGALIQMIKYSPTELSAKQTIVRCILYMLLQEAGILVFLYGVGILRTMGMGVIIALSVLGINVVITAAVWIWDRRTCAALNADLIKLRKAKHMDS